MDVLPIPLCCIVCCLLGGVLTSTPLYASRQESALSPLDLCREASASAPPGRNWAYPQDFCHLRPSLLLSTYLTIDGSQVKARSQVIGVAGEGFLESGNRLLIPPHQVVRVA